MNNNINNSFSNKKKKFLINNVNKMDIDPIINSKPIINPTPIINSTPMDVDKKIFTYDAAPMDMDEDGVADMEIDTVCIRFAKMNLDDK